MELQGKVIAITGAARGIGLAFARSAVKQGAKVAISDVNAGALDTLKDEDLALGENAHLFECDVSEREQVAGWAAAITQRFGAVDLLVNNAAAQHVGSGNITEFNMERFRQSFDVNVLGNLRTIEAFLPDMQKRRAGYIVNTASSLAIRPNAVIQHLMPYVTSKGAVLTQTWALAYALKNTGVMVSLFCPGLTKTDEKAKSTKPQASGWFDGVPEKLTKPGTMRDAVDILIDGIRNENFLICSDDGYKEAIIRLAQLGLDPLADFN
ncbi:MAG: SDR family NAD(P)-dependent oxidoreductase [Parvularculaceae bacterium]